jgi:hypothetical protein
MMAVLACAATEDPGGWSKAKWGMTDDEIVKAFDGQVAPLSKVDRYQHARVGIESLEVAGVKFKVYMSPGSDNKLDHVLFSPVNPDDATDQTFQSLENLLVQKYGRPWKTNENTATTELQWSFPTTVITLARSELNVPGIGRSVFVSLIYKKRSENPL